MKTTFILSFILLLLSFNSNAQQTIDKLNANQLKLPKESANKALYLDGAGQVKSSSTITDTELGYLEGLSDTLVNLLSGKANDSDVVKLTGNQSVGGVKTFTGKLVASSTVNGSIPCPVMTEAERDLFTPVEGDCVYNSDSLKLNVFDGSVWKDVGGAGGISLWLTANPYNVNDIVIESDKIYRCLIAHTSSVFATDLIAGNWGEVSQGLTSPVDLADGGTGVSIAPVAGSIVYVDIDSFEQVSPGSVGQILQANGSAAPSWVDKTEYSVTNFLETTLSPTQVLLETGNKNILTNPSFESSTFDSGGWINSAGSFTENFANKLDGLKSARLVLSAQTMSLIQNSVLYQASFADGVQGLASVRIKSDVALKVCSIQAGIVSTSNCVDVQANNKWGLYKVPFILGATSNGISIASTGAVTGTVYIDDAFVGAVDLKANIDSSKIAGESYFATTCAWTKPAGALGPFSANAACGGPTIRFQNMGQWQTTDTDLPKQIINNLPAGQYKATFQFASTPSVNTSMSYTINDGTTSCTTTQGNDSAALSNYSATSCVFSYSQSGNREFSLYANNGSQANLAAVYTKFNLEYFGSGSVYSSTNADTDWASCGHTTSSFTGFGTPTAIETQCKRQGGDLLMKGKFTAGIVTAVEARLSLPLWNGSQLVSAGTSLIPTIQLAGDHVRNNQGTAYFRGSILLEPSVSYITFGAQSSTQNALTKTLATALVNNSDIVSYTARIPIEGWQNSNILIGQFNGLESCTSTLDCTDTFSAQISAAGVVSNESVDFISGNCTHPSTGSNSCTFKTGIFTVAPNCVGTAVDRNNIVGTSASSTIVSANTANRTGGAIDDIITLVCQKQGVDYIGKTAKAVASDQNVRSIGATGMDIQSVQFAGATISTTCTTSPCVIHNSVGSKITSVTRPGTGDYNLNGIDGTKYICTGGANASSYVGFSHRRDLSTSTFARIQFGSGATPLDVNNSSVTCIGIP